MDRIKILALSPLVTKGINIMKTAVAVSGGADSLFSAILLQEAGHEVTAVHGLFLEPDEAAMRALQTLRETLQNLDIHLHVLDLSARFRKKVIAPFIEAYSKGKTPNPCALCNPCMKFGLLMDMAFDPLGKIQAQILATGHYARLTYNSGKVSLWQGEDNTKDQSYFLSLVPPSRLKQAVFPLADWTKQDVYKKLRACNIRIPQPTESQDICFIPDNDYTRFLEHFSTRTATTLPGPGPVLDTTGKQLGMHKGLWRYTEGQRRGLGITAGTPLYVFAKDTKNNTLIVAPKEELSVQGCTVHAVNFFQDKECWPQDIFVQTRYRQAPHPARMKMHGTHMHLFFDKKCTLPAPGQVAVCYTAKGMVLAGGIITDFLKE